jgi:hypothetical protein
VVQISVHKGNPFVKADCNLIHNATLIITMQQMIPCSLTESETRGKQMACHTYLTEQMATKPDFLTTDNGRSNAKPRPTKPQGWPTNK